MGCFDVQCFACGNTCHYYFFDNSIEEIEEEYKKYLEKGKKIKKNSYYKDVFKKIDEDPKYIEKLKETATKTRWLEKCTFLTTLDEVIHDCKEVSCNITFEDKKGNEYYNDINYDIYVEIENKPKRGIFLHDDCYKFIKSTYKIDLKYSDVAVIPKERDYYKINPKIKYGVIEKYWGQDFRFEKMIIDNNEYMAESPLKNEKNAKRIKKIISQFKFNTDKNRKGPSVSATFYPEKTIKYGINNLLWIKSKGKWNEISDSNENRKIEIDIYNMNDKQKKYLNSMVCYGEQSEKAIMIKKIVEGKKNKMMIEFIGTKEEIEKLLKLLKLIN